MNLGFIGFGEAAYALSCAFAKISAADLSSASPKLMEEAAAVIEKTGALFADAAQLNMADEARPQPGDTAK